MHTSVLHPNVGSIPACTGKPDTSLRLAAVPGVYPRMYGETAGRRRPPDDFAGLSPHVRGNPRIAPRRPWQSRSIPACTGKPSGRRLGRHRSEVYPRMYGETPASMTSSMPCSGLSPHVRGNPAVMVMALRNSRSIPACTGKPGWAPAGTGPGWVYPRMYGETGPHPFVQPLYLGLSPHVRGNPVANLRAVFSGGSIPACTGKPAAR